MPTERETTRAMQMDKDELSCGEELAASAEVPRALAALMGHVASNLRAHATWVGTETSAARGEHDAMARAADAYVEISESAERAAQFMTTLKTLPPAPHDPDRRNIQEFEVWMRTKIQLQRDLANMLLRHADESERVLDMMQQ